MINQQILQNVNQSWQTLANPTNSVDYSSHILSATLPISIQHFLKYSETIKKEQVGQPLNSGNLLGGMDPTGFNMKSDMMGLKNGITSHGMNGVGGMIHSGMNNHSHGLDSGNMVETTASVPTTTTTTKSGKKKKIKPPKVKTVRIHFEVYLLYDSMLKIFFIKIHHLFRKRNLDRNQVKLEKLRPWTVQHFIVVQNVKWPIRLEV